jgi:hypothetical protein
VEWASAPEGGPVTAATVWETVMESGREELVPAVETDSVVPPLPDRPAQANQELGPSHTR